MASPLTTWIERQARSWRRVWRQWLGDPIADAPRSKEDAKAEFEAMGRLAPILSGTGTAYVSLLERAVTEGAADQALIEAATAAGVATRALRLVPRPVLDSMLRQEYVAGVFAYAEALIAVTERQIVISRQLWTARQKKDLAAELLLGAAQDQLLIDLLEQENVFQHAAADAIRTANPQYFVTRARAALNTAMIHLLERPDAAGQPLAPPNLVLARQFIDEAEALLRKASASAPRYYEWLRRHEDPSGLLNTAPMRTAMRSLRQGLEESIATEHAIASGARALADAVDGAPSLAMRLGHGPHPHVTIAGLVARRLPPAQGVRKS